MLDMTLLQPLRSSLEADGYELHAREENGRIGIRIAATERACPECLVPKPLMRGILSQSLRVAEDLIDLSYPEDHVDAPAPATAPGTGTASGAQPPPV